MLYVKSPQIFNKSRISHSRCQMVTCNNCHAENPNSGGTCEPYFYLTHCAWCIWGEKLQ